MSQPEKGCGCKVVEIATPPDDLSETRAMMIDYCQMHASAGKLLEAAKEIAKGEGRYSRDPLEHASNTIEDMKALALAAIAQAEMNP